MMASNIRMRTPACRHSSRLSSRSRWIIPVLAILFVVSAIWIDAAQQQQTTTGKTSGKTKQKKHLPKQVVDEAGSAGLSARREDLTNDSPSVLPAEHASSALDAVLNAPAKSKNALMIVGPSAAGKTTLAKRLVADLGEQVYMLARHTSREPRHNEINGTDYIFVSRQDILAKLKMGEFVTVSELADNIYGISKEALHACVKASTHEGKLCMTEMMVSSMVLDALHMIPELNGVFVFIRTPNITVMEERLRGRKTETDDAVASRVHQAKADMTFCNDKRHLVNYCLTNNDLEYTYNKLKSIVRVEFPFVTFPGDTNCSATRADFVAEHADNDDDDVDVVDDVATPPMKKRTDKKIKETKKEK